MAGAGDMDHVGSKFLELGREQPAVAQAAQVETHIGLEPQRAAAHGQLHAAYRAQVPTARLRPGVDAEQRIAAALGEALQRAAGQSHAVHFVEAVGEKGDSRHRLPLYAGSCAGAPTGAGRRAGRGSRAAGRRRRRPESLTAGDCPARRRRGIRWRRSWNRGRRRDRSSGPSRRCDPRSRASRRRSSS